MKNLKPMTLEHAKEELEYIRSVNPHDPGEGFLHSRQSFAGYCNMQANYVLYSGFRIIAQDMLLCRDIADPSFRSGNAKEGWEIIGNFAFPPVPAPGYAAMREALRAEQNES